jgi:hypothetical protein
MKDRQEKYLNFSKITMGDYLTNIGTSEGMNQRKKVRRCAMDSCDSSVLGNIM